MSASAVSAVSSIHETPWMWTVEFHERLGRPGPHQGYTADLESAKQAFWESWER